MSDEISLQFFFSAPLEKKEKPANIFSNFSIFFSVVLAWAALLLLLLCLIVGHLLLVSWSVSVGGYISR